MQRSMINALQEDGVAAAAQDSRCKLYNTDEYGFILPRNESGDATTEANRRADCTLATSTDKTASLWTVDALRKEEGWWASDFLLYLTWKSATLSPAVPPPAHSEDLPREMHDDASVTRAAAASPSLSDDDVDAMLLERWFWSRWGTRLRRCGGCPHMSLRTLLWGFFSGAWQQSAHAQQREAAAYTSCLSRADATTCSPEYAAALESIDRDLGRTFPHHVLFQGTAARSCGQAQLRRLLSAYAAQDREVGYCQGMAFVAAVVLMVAPELEAYHIFCALMRDCDRASRARVLGGQHGMRQLYRSGFPLLQTLLAELKSHIELLLPALAAHLQSMEVDISMFASRWFLTLFVHQLPPPLLLRVWDFFLVRGWSVMVQVAVALLHQEQGALLKLNLEGILLHLKGARSRRHNEGELLRRVCSVPLL